MMTLWWSDGMRRLKSVLRASGHSGTLSFLQAIPNNDAYLNRRFPSRPWYTSHTWTYSLSLVRLVAVLFNRTSQGGVIGRATEGFLRRMIVSQCRLGCGKVRLAEATAGWIVMLTILENARRIIAVSTVERTRTAVSSTFFSILDFVSHSYKHRKRSVSFSCKIGISPK